MSIPIEMTAIEITKPGGPEVLHAVRRPVPRPGNGEVLIRVEAAGVNRPDVLQRRGHYPPPPGASDLPGLEVAGTIVEIGAAAPRWQVNDRVCALVAGGGYAEYCVAPAPQCLPIPENLDVVAAAAIPETFFTVWTNLFQRGALRAGERVLIHGGSSGIGTTAIQLAHVLGAVVYTTAGSDDKCAACQQLGATVAINYRDSDFVVPPEGSAFTQPVPENPPTKGARRTRATAGAARAPLAYSRPSPPQSSARQWRWPRARRAACRR